MLNETKTLRLKPRPKFSSREPSCLEILISANATSYCHGVCDVVEFQVTSVTAPMHKGLFTARELN